MSVLTDIFGRKPKVPPLKELSLPEEQQKAITANIAAAPQAGSLARLSQEQIRDMMRFAVPGFDQITGQVSSTIEDFVHGRIPSDVTVASRMGSASRALAGGYASGRPGSAGSNLEARDLGITSLNLINQGLSTAASWLSSMERLYAPSQALFSSMFISPQQEFAAATQERDLQFQRSWLQNQISAMPDPVARGLWDTTMELVGDVLSVYGGQGQKHQSYYGSSRVSGGNWGQMSWGLPNQDYDFNNPAINPGGDQTAWS